MHKLISVFLFAALTVLLVAFAPAQGKKSNEPPKPAQSPSQELLWGWNGTGAKLIAMAEDFPEDKYNFKAQKDERTFGENLLHVAVDYYFMINAIKGSEVGYTGNDDSVRIKYPTKKDIVKYLKQAVADGAELIKAQGDSGLTREFKFPWGNFMTHGSFGWMGTIEHAGEHYGQLVVYYRLNGMVPPASRPKK
jgi:uncharacterized damage-inducible protein DinB